MTQHHLVIDFPIRGPANAEALREELPPLMPDLAKAQDEIGTVHFSRFMIQGDEKLVFLSDIDGAPANHVAQLVEFAGSLLDTIFVHVDSPPQAPVADNRDNVVDWLTSHVREPLDMYFAYEATVQEIKAAAREAAFTGTTMQSPLLLMWTIRSRLQGVAMKFDTMNIGEAGHEASDSIGTLHNSHFVPFGTSHLAFFTIFDGDMQKYFQDFVEKTSFVFDSIFPHVVGSPPTPVAKHASAFYQYGVDYNYPPIGFYTAYPGLSVQDIRALLADRTPQPAI